MLNQPGIQRRRGAADGAGAGGTRLGDVAGFGAPDVVTRPVNDGGARSTLRRGPGHRLGRPPHRHRSAVHQCRQQGAAPHQRLGAVRGAARDLEQVPDASSVPGSTTTSSCRSPTRRCPPANSPCRATGSTGPRVCCTSIAPATAFCRCRRDARAASRPAARGRRAGCAAPAPPAPPPPPIEAKTVPVKRGLRERSGHDGARPQLPGLRQEPQAAGCRDRIGFHATLPCLIALLAIHREGRSPGTGTRRFRYSRRGGSQEAS